MFVQIHMLQSMPPGNLNRDETGQPKKCLFGGVTRGRISSQCLKRNIRQSKEFQAAIEGELANRTRQLPKLVADALTENGAEIPTDDVPGLVEALKKYFRKEDGQSPKSETDEPSEAMTGQLVFFPPSFAQEIARLVVQFRQDEPKAYQRMLGKKLEQKPSKKEDDELKKKIGVLEEAIAAASKRLTVDIGLFGRMTTSPLVVDVEATCQVAHAISTHETIIESDYFTAMDDLKNEPGAAFMGSGDTETFFNSAVYYKYLNVDLDALADDDHLKGMDKQSAGRVAGGLLRAAALVNPSGKQNSFASHSVPELILVELSETKRPLSYANAFLQAVSGGPDKNLMSESASALTAYIDSIASAYSSADTRRHMLQAGKAQAEMKTEHQRAETLGELIANVEALIAKEG